MTRRASRAMETQIEEIVEELGCRGKRPVDRPGETHVHSRDIGGDVARIDPLPFERPWSVHHVGQPPRPLAGPPHAPPPLDRGGGKKGLGPKAARPPIIADSLLRLV